MPAYDLSSPSELIIYILTLVSSDIVLVSHGLTISSNAANIFGYFKFKAIDVLHSMKINIS